MVREIIKDTEALSQKCEKITDIRRAREIVQDLIDTALHNNETNEKKCCGLAANQIGENVRVIIAQMPNGKFEPFINPAIVDHSKTTLMSTEGCMSLDGERTVERYERIVVMAQNMAGKFNKRTFGGFTAIELQHEIDHTNGILI
jgi:peptide deformylase